MAARATYLSEFKHHRSKMILYQDKSDSSFSAPRYQIAAYTGRESIEAAANFICMPPIEVRIEPEALNLHSKGVCTAHITVPKDYEVHDRGVSDVVCKGAPQQKASGPTRYRSLSRGSKRRCVASVLRAGSAVASRSLNVLKTALTFVLLPSRIW